MQRLTRSSDIALIKMVKTPNRDINLHPGQSTNFAI